MPRSLSKSRSRAHVVLGFGGALSLMACATADPNTTHLPPTGEVASAPELAPLAVDGPDYNALCKKGCSTNQSRCTSACPPDTGGPSTPGGDCRLVCLSNYMTCVGACNREYPPTLAPPEPPPPDPTAPDPNPPIGGAR